MDEEIDPLLMLACTSDKGMGRYNERYLEPGEGTSRHDDFFSLWDAQDHCYDKREECDLIVNTEHSYYTRVNQSELPDNLEHSYARALPYRPEDTSAKRSSGNNNDTELHLNCCQWDTCQFMFETIEDLYDHIVNSHATKHIRTCLMKDCNRDGKKFGMRYLLTRHIAAHIQHTAFRCDQCGRAFVTVERLRLHVKSIHNLEVTHICPHCNELFKTTSDRTNHIARAHLKVRFPCPNCKKSYAGRSSLRVHLKKCGTGSLQKKPAPFRSTTS